jgi:cysteine desulfurase
MKTIYLDYAAATPVDPGVIKAMEPYFTDKFYNPSATYLAAKQVRQDLEAARASIAKILGSRPAEIIFTSGATEANNLAINGVASDFPGSEVLVSSIEHESVLEPAKKFNARKIPVSKTGVIGLDQLKKMINDDTVLVSVMMVNNELGTLQPLKDVAALVKRIREDRLELGNELPLYFHTDAAQATNFFDLHLSRLGVDMMSVNGAKIYGSKQSGVLYVKAGTKLSPQIKGGKQEFGLRSGTENIAAAIGFAKALEMAQNNRAVNAKKITELKEYFAKKLQKEIDTSVINGSMKHSAPHILNITFPGQDNERLMMWLDERGVQVATGSACSASNQEPSHVLQAIGLSGSEARSSLRFSLGRFTTKTDIDRTVELLNQFIGS